MIFSPSRARAMDSQDKWSREFDRYIKLVCGRVSEWCLRASTFPCVFDPLVSRLDATAAAAINF